MKNSKPTHLSYRKAKIVLLLCWLTLIFGTSCTVVRPAEFFQYISQITGAGPEAMEQFSMFWAISWFTIVKGWHFIEFAILTFLSASFLKWWFERETTGTIAGAMCFCTFYAATDEWHQTFVPDRNGTIQDVLIDALGVLVAGGILLIRYYRGASTAT